MKSVLKVFVVLVLIVFICAPVLAAKKKSSKKPKELLPQKIEYISRKDFKIVANLWLPPNIEKNTRVPLVILLHSIAESKQMWDPYAKELAEKGYSVLAIDLRGHGESNKRKSKRLYWRSFESESWNNMLYDVTEGINYLKQNNPEVNINKIIIVGSSLGANVAVVAAEKEKDKVKGIALLSPFGNYKGIEARVPLVNYGAHPLLIIVSKTDKLCYDASNELVKYAQGKYEIVLVKNAGHGIFMLRFEPKLKEKLYNWLAQNLPPTAEQLPPTAKKSKGKKEKSSSHH